MLNPSMVEAPLWGTLRVLRVGKYRCFPWVVWGRSHGLTGRNDDGNAVCLLVISMFCPDSQVSKVKSDHPKEQ